MKYYKACPDCEAALDPGEKCKSCQLHRELVEAIEQLTEAEKRELLAEWKKYKAAQSAANTQSGMVEQIATPVSTSIVSD